MTVVNPEFMNALESAGKDAGAECFNCGTCAAVCPLVSGHFPRKMIRYAQVGAWELILADAKDLWRCLHCGLCTRTCPRGANPGEVVLTLKRHVLAAWRNS